jgi:hypothetical protein
LWRKVRSIGFKFITPRAFNQDLLENFFSCVRGYAGANSKPTPTSFAHTTKALLVNNLISPRAVGANGEDDGSLSYLDNLKTFLNTEVAIPETPLVSLVALRKLVKKCTETGSILNVKKIRKHLVHWVCKQ